MQVNGLECATFDAYQNLTNVMKERVWVLQDLMHVPIDVSCLATGIDK
jgi:hypothetical protein